MKISFKKIAKSLRGFSVPIFGISWDPPKSEKKIARDLIIFLEDRRVLFYPYHMEIPGHVVDSILEIRTYLTNALQELEENSEIEPHLRAMRAACRKFLDSTKGRYYMGDETMQLGEFRGVFGFQVAQVCVKYGIDISTDLATILPLEDSEELKE